MGVLATDNFDRADDVELGANWDPQTGEAGDFRITSNAAEPQSFTAGDAAENYNAITWPDNQYSQGKITTEGTLAGTGVGVMVRASTSARTYYAVYVSKAASNNVLLRKRLAGTPTTLQQITVTWVNSNVLKLEVETSGSNALLRIYQNGSQIGTTTTDSTSPIASGRAGIAYSSTATSGNVNDWEGGDLVASASLMGAICL